MTISRVDVRAVCDIGCVRRVNEDMVLVGHEFVRDRTYVCDNWNVSGSLVFAVADGVGGLDAGEEASQSVLERLETNLADIVRNLGPSDTALQELGTRLNHFAQETAAKLPPNSGSTLAGLLLLENEIYCFHAGDSRLWLQDSRGLRRLTRDHSLRELGGDPSAPSNVIINAIGGVTRPYVELSRLSSFGDGDIFLVSSDGLHDLVESRDIEAAIAAQGVDAVIPLLQKARGLGGPDNISIVAIRLHGKS